MNKRGSVLWITLFLIIWVDLMTLLNICIFRLKEINQIKDYEYLYDYVYQENILNEIIVMIYEKQIILGKNEFLYGYADVEYNDENMKYEIYIETIYNHNQGKFYEVFEENGMFKSQKRKET